MPWAQLSCIEKQNRFLQTHWLKITLQTQSTRSETY